MNVAKVMEILDKFEVESVRAIELDKAINIDSYDSVGKYKLIKQIRKRILKEGT